MRDKIIIDLLSLLIGIVIGIIIAKVWGEQVLKILGKYLVDYFLEGMVL